jgi:NAD(P)-dependent dehydrogenase (short-subunit alcohol dehydrogenase family)
MNTVFITGASSGIGKAAALLFRRKGWQVAAAVRDPASVADLAVLEGVRVYRLDVTDPASIAAAVEEAIDDFGGIEALVNNAGYAAIGPFEASSEAQVRKQFETNVFGLMSVTRALLPHFRARRSGTIVNLSSVGGRLTFPLYSLYHATKWAVEGFTESLQFELRPFGIKLRIIEPGVIKTDFYARSMDIARKEGLDAYDAWAEPVMAAMNKSVPGSPGPELVARRIWRAATSRGRKLRWLVGRESAYVVLKRWMPDAWFLGMVRRVLGA